MFMHMVLALMLLLGLSYAWVASDRENPLAVRQAQQELDNLRGFAFSAKRFVASHGEFEGVLSWQDEAGAVSLASAPSTPGALRQIGMPAAWRVVVDKDEFVLCTALSEAAIALAGQAFPDTVSASRVRLNDQDDALVFATDADRQPGKADDAPAATQRWVEKCST